MHVIPRVRGATAALAVSIVFIGLNGCAALRSIVPSAPPAKINSLRMAIPADKQLPAPLGRMQRHEIRPEETLLDVAREAGLGFNELQDANRGVDDWVPPVGQEVDVPTHWIPPRSSYRGVVINIPEMRLYLFPEKTNPGEEVVVHTWPIGIGTEKTPSPVGPFRITSKDENPTWYVPDSIYRTMEPPKRRVVPPGPDNPLGAYRMRLSKGLYAIHGTDSPWSIGRLTTHGCIRLYPEDIGNLFHRVRIGTNGQLVYQPIKFGETDGKIFVEVHEDIYGRIKKLDSTAIELARQAGVLKRIDPELLRRAVKEKRGVPVEITRGERTAVTTYGHR